MTWSKYTKKMHFGNGVFIDSSVRWTMRWVRILTKNESEASEYLEKITFDTSGPGMIITIVYSESENDITEYDVTYEEARPFFIDFIKGLEE